MIDTLAHRDLFCRGIIYQYYVDGELTLIEDLFSRP